MIERYRTSAGIDSASPVARVPGGIAVTTSSPLRGPTPPEATDPEQLLALAWSTCLNATVQALIGERARSRVRVEVVLAEAPERGGFAFHPTAILSVEGMPAAEADELVRRAHTRCPVSRLISAAETVSVRAEEFAAA